MSRLRTLAVLFAVAFVAVGPVGSTVAASSAASGTGGAASIGAADAVSNAVQLQTSGHSLRINSTGGADAAWNATVDVDPNTKYTYSAWVKTENVQAVDGTGVIPSPEDRDPLGATISVEQIANSQWPPDFGAIAEGQTGTNDWTHLSVTFNSSSNEELKLNALFGGYGQATGTAYWDGFSLRPATGGENLLSDPGVENGPADPWGTTTFGGSAELTVSDQESVATGNVSTRTVVSSPTRPGDSTLVAVQADPAGDSSDFTIVEQFDGAFADAQIIDADGAAFSAARNSNDEVFAAYTDRDNATLLYRVQLHRSPTATEGGLHGISGFTHSAGDRSATGGDVGVNVGIANYGPPLVQSFRTVDVSDLHADGTVNVTVTANPGEASDFTIFEEMDQSVGSIEILDADGAKYTGVKTRSDGLFAAYTDKSKVTLTYEVQLASDTAYEFNGSTDTDTSKGGFTHWTLGVDKISSEGLSWGGTGGGGGGSAIGDEEPATTPTPSDDPSDPETQTDEPTDPSSTDSPSTDSPSTEAPSGDSSGTESGDEATDASGPGFGVAVALVALLGAALLASRRNA